jgi:hypothetical protein
MASRSRLAFFREPSRRDVVSSEGPGRLESFRKNEFFDRQASEGGESFNLAMLLRFNLNGESVHTPKVANTPKVVNRRLSTL